MRVPCLFSVCWKFLIMREKRKERGYEKCLVPKTLVALIAHDNKKTDMIQFVKAYQAVFAQCRLIATGTPGRRIHVETGLEVECCQSGPFGGGQQIGSRVATGEVLDDTMTLY